MMLFHQLNVSAMQYSYCRVLNAPGRWPLPCLVIVVRTETRPYLHHGFSTLAEDDERVNMEQFHGMDNSVPGCYISHQCVF